MSKYVKVIALVVVLLFSAGMLLNCYGSYTAFTKIKSWNGTLGNKWLVSIVHAILWILPVYEICLFVDIVILNVVEFYTGSNPLAMAPGEKEIQIVKQNGESYEITATINRFDIKQLTGDNTGRTASVVYEPETKAWFIESLNAREQIIQVDENNNNIINLIYPSGSTVRVNLNETM
jgi:hypothetical protein